MIANTVGKTVDYILDEERDKPESEQTVFLLRTLSKKATAVIMDNLVGYDTTGSVIVSRPGTGALTAVRLGLAGWRNMQDQDGNDVRPHIIRTKGQKKTGLETLSPKSIDLLPQYAIDELGGEIMELNGLTKSGAEEEEAIDLDEAEDPTASSMTENASSSSPPSPPETPNSATGASVSSGPVESAPGSPQMPAPRLAIDAGAVTG